MPNQINGVPNGQLPPLGERGKSGGINSASTAASSSGSEAAASGDHLSLTPTALRLHEAEQRLADQPVVDERRVDAIRKAIEEGSYDIHPEQVAEKLVAQELVMGSRRGG